MSFWSKIKTGFKNVGNFGRKVVHDASNIGHKVLGVAHKVVDTANKIANSEIGKEVLDFVPFGGEVRQGLSVANRVVGYGDKAVGFIDRVDDGLNKVKDLDTGLAFGKQLKDDAALQEAYRGARSIQRRRTKARKK